MNFVVVKEHAYLEYIAICHYVVSHILLILNRCRDLLKTLFECWTLTKTIKIHVLPQF